MKRNMMNVPANHQVRAFVSPSREMARTKPKLSAIEKAKKSGSRVIGTMEICIVDQSFKNPSPQISKKKLHRREAPELLSGSESLATIGMPRDVPMLQQSLSAREIIDKRISMFVQNKHTY